MFPFGRLKNRYRTMHIDWNHSYYFKYQIHLSVTLTFTGQNEIHKAFSAVGALKQKTLTITSKNGEY